MIYANEMQHKAITSTKEVTLLVNGCGSGQSYALILKALASECKNISLFINYDLSVIEEIFNTSNIKYRLSKHSNIFTFNCGKKVKIIKGYTSLTVNLSSDLILIDNVHNFPISLIDEALESKAKKVFTSYPYRCGYITKNKEHVSWDYCLINWTDTMEYCTPKDYCDSVEVITGYGINTYLQEDSKTYKKCIESLPEIKRLQLMGSWDAPKDYLHN